MGSVRSSVAGEGMTTVALLPVARHDLLISCGSLLPTYIPLPVMFNDLDQRPRTLPPVCGITIRELKEIDFVRVRGRQTT
jgi:hypothetical protein